MSEIAAVRMEITWASFPFKSCMQELCAEKSLAMPLLSCTPTSKHLERLLRSHKHKPFLLQTGVSTHSAFFHVKDSSVLSSSLWK